jgi:hypothetical protein
MMRGLRDARLELATEPRPARIRYGTTPGTSVTSSDAKKSAIRSRISEFSIAMERAVHRHKRGVDARIAQFLNEYLRLFDRDALVERVGDKKGRIRGVDVIERGRRERAGAVGEVSAPEVLQLHLLKLGRQCAEFAPVLGEVGWPAELGHCRDARSPIERAGALRAQKRRQVAAG